MTWETARTCVYDIYVDGALVYVGCSRVPDARFKRHKKAGKVPSHAVLKVVRWYPMHIQAMAAELRRIRSKKPPLNEAGRIPNMRQRMAGQAKRQRELAKWEAKREYFAAMVREAEQG